MALAHPAGLDGTRYSMTMTRKMGAALPAQVYVTHEGTVTPAGPVAPRGDAKALPRLLLNSEPDA